MDDEIRPTAGAGDISLSPKRQRVLSRRALLQLSAVSLGALGATSLLAACGGGSETPAPADGEGDGGTQPTATSASGGDEGQQATPQKGGELVIANEQNPVSLDPHFVRDVGSSRAMFYLYDPLIAVDEETALVPGLAESWEVTDDGLEYTLKLRMGVTFHDGTPFNADAVKVNLERQWDEATNTRYHDDFVEYVASIDVIDESTVKIRLHKLYILFLRELLAFGSGHMVSPTALQELGDEFAQKPVGTGPFKFEEFVQDSHVVMVRNDDYWQGAPHLDRLRVRIIPEQSVQIVELEAGNVDVGFSVQAKDVERLKAAGVNIVAQPAITATFISMNLAKGPTRELAVRRAIAMAVDRQAIVDELLLGYGQISRGGSPKGWPRYHEDIPIDEYNPEEAARILDEAGWVMGSDGVRVRNGEILKVNILSTQLERALSYGLMNEFIQQSLERIGFATELRTLEWGAYLDEFRAGEWWHVTFHAQNQNAKELVGATLEPEGYWNVNQIGKVTEGELVEVADQIRAYYDEMNSSLDPKDQIAAWKKIQMLVQEHQLISWLVHWDYLVAVNQRVHGLRVKPTLNNSIYQIHEVWIEQ